jgi:EAL domain-containing protein (putative c-di-GMP-specific phosphodiesterase class I)/GGDEF domain-containing protein
MNAEPVALDLGALGTSDVPAMVVDAEGRILAASVELERVLAWKGSIVGVSLDELLHEAELGGPWINGASRVLLRHDRLAITVQTWMLPLDPGGGRRLVVLVDDTSSRRRLADLAYQAHHDQASRLPNKAHALEQIELLLDEGLPVALVVVELQRFDSMLSLLGEQYAGTLLGSAAKRIEQIALPGDVVARIGPTQLLVIRPGVDEGEDALDLAVAIVDAVGQSVELGTASFPTGATCGASVALPGDSSESALHDGELALRHAVGAGHEVAWFDPSMRDVEHRQLMLERALQEAVASQSFELHLQPIVDAVDGTIQSFEGLARWSHPTFGQVSPVEFIPIAERSGLIREIGEWSLAAALSIIAGWRERGVRCVPIAVNLSATQLLDAAYTRLLIDSVTAHDAVDLITAEVTESVMLSPGAGARLRELAEHGVGVAIDDFGTGFSALSYLADHPLRTLKIDRSFVVRLGEERNRVLVAGTIALAHQLGLRTIAEGVETAAELTILREMGCDSVQGYHTGRPAPAGTFESRLGQVRASAVP